MAGFNNWNGGRPPIAGPRRDAPTPIFTETDSDIIPGEVIVQLDESAAARITESIPRGPTRGIEGPTATAFGIDRLDDAIQCLKITSITRLHPPAPVFTATAEAAVALASTFRLSFADKKPVAKAVETLQAAPGVQYAEANRYRESYAVPNDPSYPNQWGLAKINCPHRLGSHHRLGERRGGGDRHRRRPRPPRAGAADRARHRHGGPGRQPDSAARLPLRGRLPGP
jgi:hypothetical protein